MSNLHAQIMNLPCDTSTLPAGYGHDTAYAMGHREARHAAAELAIAVEQQRDELLAALDKCLCRALPHPDDTDADRVRNLYHVVAIARTAIAKVKDKQ